MKVLVVPYDSNWPSDFQTEKTCITRALSEFEATIEHIGSTSISGLSAKPTIDIMIGVLDLTFLDRTIEPMVAAGYTYNARYENEIPERRLYQHLEAVVPGSEIPQRLAHLDLEYIRKSYVNRVNIHLVVRDSNWWKRHLLFRSYLRSHPEAVRAYQELKLRLAEQDWADTNDYANAKTEFIRNIEKIANNENSNTGS